MYVCFRHVAYVVYCVSMKFFFCACVHTDLWPLCGKLTSAMCCLVFVVKLEYAGVGWQWDQGLAQSSGVTV